MKKNTASKPTVGIIMGSQSDWSTMGEAAALLKQLDIPLETKIVSAHRTPKLLYSYAEEAEERGIQVIIAGAGGAIAVGTDRSDNGPAGGGGGA